jgi:hypothetical protein
MQTNANTTPDRGGDKRERLPTRLAFARDVAVLFLYRSGYNEQELSKIFNIKRQQCEIIINKYKEDLRLARDR